MGMVQLRKALQPRVELALRVLVSPPIVTKALPIETRSRGLFFVSELIPGPERLRADRLMEGI